jgi:hypothetical protein
MQAVDERETFRLIGSDKVEGTKVYGPDGNHIGHVERLMIGKLDGRVSYAVLAFGGFLGMGEDYYPLPWAALTYREDLGGYVVNVTEEELKQAPKYADEHSWDWENRDYPNQVDTYWSRLT